MNVLRQSDYNSITHTMRQLIFRLNLQQHRNKKYKGKTTHETIQLDGAREAKTSKVTQTDIAGTQPRAVLIAEVGN